MTGNDQRLISRPFSGHVIQQLSIEGAYPGYKWVVGALLRGEIGNTNKWHGRTPGGNLPRAVAQKQS